MRRLFSFLALASRNLPSALHDPLVDEPLLVEGPLEPLQEDSVVVARLLSKRRAEAAPRPVSRLGTMLRTFTWPSKSASEMLR